MQQNVNQSAGFEGEEDFAAMFEASIKEGGRTGLVKEGEVIKGTVIRVTPEFAIVDIGYKSEGQVAISEFTSAKGEVAVKPGDTGRGVPRVPRERHGHGRPLQGEGRQDADLGRDLGRGEGRRDHQGHHRRAREGRPPGRHRRQGVPARHQVDIRPVRNLDQYLAKEFEFKVIKFNQKRGNIVLSRRVLLEKQREEQKKETLKNLKEGAIMKGQVKNLTDYGAFIDLGGIDGLLHITDMSWGRVGHPSRDVRRSATRSRSSSSSSTPRRSASASASSRSRKTRGTAPTRSTRSARASRARSSASPTTARSSSSSRASRAWCTSAR